jgi:hypothetical protein
MLIQAAVGLLGFYYHTAANFGGPSSNQFDNFVYSVPAMAPLLFPNLALLAVIALDALRGHLPMHVASQPAGAGNEHLAGQ